MRLVICLLALALARPGWADGSKSQALAIFERAIAAEKDPQALAKQLAEVDALIASNAKDADAHYVRGWILSRGREHASAVAAYDKAFELDPRLADAAYNAGVVLGRDGELRQAIVRFERALKTNPKHVDAAYNAGQSYYDLGDFKVAAERWEVAARLSPEDFQIAKKLVQAYVALARPDKVKKARDRVFAMWRANKAPEGKLGSYVYDQFAAGKYRVYVHEMFDTSGDRATIWQAKIAQGNKVVGSVSLETSAELRAKGTPYGLVVDKGVEHVALEPTWKALPDYAAFKTLVGKTIEARF